jgi:Calcineurin-like phosphoesterase
MHLWAISDLHVDHAINREGLRQLPSFGDDWLLIAGDVAESAELLTWALDELSVRFGKVFWTPGNHELWTRRDDPAGRGVERYNRLVDICRSRGCVTPDDPYEIWNGPQDRIVIAPVFTLYDYSFRPPSVSLETCIDWAIQADVVCTDEFLLDTHPHASPIAWCHARVVETERRLEEVVARTSCGTILLSHFPLRRRDAHLPSIPQFELWCGTSLTEDWLDRFRARACIFGHLHRPRSFVENECRFEEVSLGYPGQWRHDLGVAAHLRRLSFPSAAEFAADLGLEELARCPP